MTFSSLLDLNKAQLLSLAPEEVDWILTSKEIFHMADLLGAYWQYDYAALDRGIPGYHAQLKSGLCSDGFFNAKALLAHNNLRRIIAGQMVMKLDAVRRSVQPKGPLPGYVFGIPDAASKLAEDVADILGLPLVKLVKNEGRIAVEGEVPADKTGLPVEDICTKGTGFREGVCCLLDAQPRTLIYPHELLILNRGGLSVIEVRGKCYATAALVDERMNEWEYPCTALCKRGSIRIKPKETEENWRLITTAQKVA